jgi:hypothetical protein
VTCPSCARAITSSAESAPSEKAWWIDSPTAPAASSIQSGNWWAGDPAPAPKATACVAPSAAVTSTPAAPAALPPLPQLPPLPSAARKVSPAILAGAAAALLAVAGTVAVLAVPARSTEEGLALASGGEETTPPAEPAQPGETPSPALSEPEPSPVQTVSAPPPPPAPREELLTIMPALVESSVEPLKTVKGQENALAASAPPPAKLRVKHRRETCEDDLRKQIESAPELTLFRTFTRLQASQFAATTRLAARSSTHETTPVRILNRPDLAGLPLRLGEACKLSPSVAEHLQGGSVGLRAHLTESRGAAARRVARAGADDPRPDPNILHDRLRADADKHNKWLKPEAIPALQQMLIAENEAIREVLIDQLSDMEGAAASVAWPSARSSTCTRACASWLWRRCRSDPRRNIARCCSTASAIPGAPLPTTPPRPSPL